MLKSGSNDLVLPLIAILVKSDGAGKLILMVHLIVMAWASNFTKEILMSFKKILMTSMSPSRRNVKVKTRETQAVMEENDTRA